ncbi:MAG: type II secretion system secretin GspD [Hyphomicrobiales bacterium]|nr:type II secretion system secretin GspD [Hyphomicrobiales bacterium]MBV8664033.1 type II secretion system secretin GspD [Hyphomicrobiales bacterium]
MSVSHIPKGGAFVSCGRNIAWLGRRCLVVGSVLALAGCSPTLEERSDEAPTAADAVRNADFQPRFPTATNNPSPSGSGFKGFSFFGSNAAPARSPAPAPDGGTMAGGAQIASAQADGAGVTTDGFTLNFEAAPIANVAKAVLSDILGVSYEIDPRVQGSVTLATGRPISKKDVLFVLESGLRANNLVMIRDGAGYRIAPLAEGAPGATDFPGGDSTQAGYGMSVIPLQYVSGPTIAKLLEGFAARPGAIRTDPSGRLLMVVGTGPERQSAVETVRSFDVDWLRGQSVGMYPVHNSEPDPIVGELEKIMDSGETGLGHGLVKFQPVARQNAILVVAAKPELLRTAARWISQLDSPTGASAGVTVYKVHYGDAKQIAALLQNIFLGGGGAGDGGGDQTAPSSGAASLSATERLTGGASNHGSSSSPSPVSNASATSGSSPNSSAKSGSSPFGNVATAALTNAFAQGNAGAAILPGVRITPDESTNSLLIYANAESYRTIERALDQLDRPRMQVAIDVTIAEVTLNDQLNYGVQFYLTNNAGSLINSATGQPTAGVGANPGFNVFVGGSTTPNVIINALHALTDVKILSNPSLVVVDNEKASLEVGDQVPITTGSATVLSANNAVVNTVAYQNTGIILHVQPHVSPNDNVTLAIEQEISSVPNNNGSTPNLTPTISQRKVDSMISVASGQTVVLAGLVSDTRNKSRSGIPVLDQLPMVGGAFSTTSVSDARTELVVMIHPQVVHNGADAAEVAEQLRAKMRSGRIESTNVPAALNVLAKPAQ